MIDTDVLKQTIEESIEPLRELLTFLKLKMEETSLKEASEVYLTVKQVSEMTHYAEATIRIKVMTNEIPSLRVNGRRLFRKSDILVWLAQGGGK